MQISIPPVIPPAIIPFRNLLLPPAAFPPAAAAAGTCLSKLKIQEIILIHDFFYLFKRDSLLSPELTRVNLE